MITKPSDHMKNDSRFRSWGKVVTAADVNLAAEKGYALGGRWVEWNETVSLTAGQYLVCAAETGSRKSHDYSYRLIDGEGNRVEQETRIATLDTALAAGKITEEQRVRAINSILYAYALYISPQ